MKTKKSIAAAVIAGLVALGGGYFMTQEAYDQVKIFEGKRNEAYPDIVYGWDLATICYGHTKGVGMFDYKTDEECEVHFKEDMAEGCKVVARAIGRNRFDALTQGEKDGYCSFAHSTGYFKTQRSGPLTSMYRRLMGGDRVGACKALLMYDKANGKVLPGLTRRRQFEYRLCVSELG